MNNLKFHLPVYLFILIIGLGSSLLATSSVDAQEPNPTTTPEITGMFITVISNEPQINVRMGPSSIAYPIVGALLPGQTASALGRSPGGDWIQIAYPGAPYDSGWVYAPLVRVSPGTLRIIEPPPTPEPPATPTIDPTLLAQFSIVPTLTRLPTFTPPPTLSMRIYTETPPNTSSIPFPIAGIVIFFAVTGLIGFLLSIIPRK